MDKAIKQMTALVLAVLFLGLTGCAGRSPQPEAPKNGTLVIGSDIYSPYFYLDDNGNFAGIDVEIASEACRRLEKKAEFRQIVWQDKDTFLNAGTVDCLWGSFSMNDREDEYAWAGPYMHSRQVVAVNATSNIYSLCDLNDKCIAVQNGSKPEMLFLTDAVPGVSVKKVYSFSTMPSVFAALKKGYVDACAGHETACRDHMKNITGDYRILDEILLKADLGVAFNKETGREQAAELTAVLEEMKKDGTIRSILEKYDLDVDFALKGDGA